MQKCFKFTKHCCIHIPVGEVFQW